MIKPDGKTYKIVGKQKLPNGCFTNESSISTGWVSISVWISNGFINKFFKVNAKL